MPLKSAQDLNKLIEVVSDSCDIFVLQGMVVWEFQKLVSKEIIQDKLKEHIVHSGDQLQNFCISVFQSERNQAFIAFSLLLAIW